VQKQLAVKLGILLVVASIIVILLQQVKQTVFERKFHREHAAASIRDNWAGVQRLVSPILVIPYNKPHPGAKAGYYIDVDKPNHQKYIYLFPTSSNIQVKATTTLLRKGIYGHPVYHSTIAIQAAFDEQEAREHLERLQRKGELDSAEQPYIALYISDLRGLDQTPVAQVNGRDRKVVAGSKMPHQESGLHIPLDKLTTERGEITLTATLSLRGTEQLSVLPLGHNSHLQIDSNWPHPQFTGSSLPREREVTDKGFSANWLTTPYATGGENLTSSCQSADKCLLATHAGIGVHFIQPVDVYLQVQRSLKYAMLFVGLSFICFFVFECLNPIRIHPIQYLFAGLAMACFYLLLLSLAEHIDFAYASATGVIACSALLLVYVRHMFSELRSAVLFIAGLVGLYSLLYAIIQAEDYALLMGSALVFSILSMLMYVTRRINWYRFGEAG